MVARRDETRPTGAARLRSEHKSQTDPACAGRRIVTECRAHDNGNDNAAGNGEAEPAVFPFCSAECSPAAGGEIVASMSGARQGEFHDPPDAGGARAPREPALRQGALYPPSCRHKKDGHLPGETRPITANRRHPKNQQQGSEP